MKKFNDCCREVAEKHKLHFSGFAFYKDGARLYSYEDFELYKEATELFAKEVAKHHVNKALEAAGEVAFNSADTSYTHEENLIKQWVFESYPESSIDEAFKKEKGV